MPGFDDDGRFSIDGSDTTPVPQPVNRENPARGCQKHSPIHRGSAILQLAEWRRTHVKLQRPRVSTEFGQPRNTASMIRLRRGSSRSSWLSADDARTAQPHRRRVSRVR